MECNHPSMPYYQRRHIPQKLLCVITYTCDNHSLGWGPGMQRLLHTTELDPLMSLMRPDMVRPL